MQKTLRTFAAVIMAMVVLLGRGEMVIGQSAGLVDYWGPLHNLKTSDGYPAAAIHLARLCDGRTLLMGFDWNRPPYGQPQSVTAYVVPQTLSEVAAAPSTPVNRSLVRMNLPLDKPYNPLNPSNYDINICGGTAFTHDGRLKVGGITRPYADGTTSLLLGTSYGIELNATGTTWRRLPNAFVGSSYGVNWRWYTTYTPIASPPTRSSSTLITGGSVVVDIYNAIAPPEDPTRIFWPNRSIEIDDDSGTNKLVISHEQSSPDIDNGTGYPHVIPQQNGQQLIHGAAGRPIMLSIDGATLISTFSRRPGPLDVADPSDSSSTAPLPMYWNNQGPYPNGSFAVCGGKPGTAYESSFDVYNVATGLWSHFEMGVKRTWCTLKPLPDGRLAIMGGLAMDGSNGQGKTQIFDPVTNTIESGTSVMATKRGYHTTSILQNDGSLFVCAGIPVMLTINKEARQPLESPTCQTYWPDYILKPKPYLGAVPATIALGATFDVIWYDKSNLRPIVDARLVSLPTDTHGFDSGQRNVQLKVVKSVPTGTPNWHILTLQMPQAASGSVADTAHTVPPGCYTLFIIDSQRVPSPGMSTKVVW